MKRLIRNLLVASVCGFIAGVFMAMLTRSRNDDVVMTTATAAGAIVGAIRCGVQEICNAIRERRK